MNHNGHVDGMTAIMTFRDTLPRKPPNRAGRKKLRKWVQLARSRHRRRLCACYRAPEFAPSSTAPVCRVRLREYWRAEEMAREIHKRRGIELIATFSVLEAFLMTPEQRAAALDDMRRRREESA